MHNIGAPLLAETHGASIIIIPDPLPATIIPDR